MKGKQDAQKKMYSFSKKLKSSFTLFILLLAILPVEEKHTREISRRGAHQLRTHVS